MKIRFTKFCVVLIAVSLLLLAVHLHDDLKAATPDLVIPAGYKLVAELFNIETDSATIKGTGHASGSYQFAVNLNQPSGHFSSDILVEGTKVVALFDSVQVPQMYILNYNVTPEIGGDIQASSSDLANGVAYFDYEHIYNFYMSIAPSGVEFSEITNIAIQAKTDPLTVYRVYVIQEEGSEDSTIPSIVIPAGYTLVDELFNIETDNNSSKGTGQADAGYQFAVNLNQPSGHFDSDDLSSGRKLVALYEGIDAPQLYIQNYNSHPAIGGAIQTSSHDSTHGVAFFNYEDIYNFYMNEAPPGVQFSDITNLALQSKANPLTIYRVYIIKEDDDVDIFIPNGYRLVTEFFNIETDSTTIKGPGYASPGYNNAVNLNQPSGHFSHHVLVEGTKIVVLFDSKEVPQMYIQNYNATPEIEGSFQASSSNLSTGVAYFDYKDIYNFYMNQAPPGIEFHEITNIIIQSKYYALTVFRVYIIENETDSITFLPKTIYNYDINGRLEEVIFHTGQKIQFEYDLNGNLLKRTLINQ